MQRIFNLIFFLFVILISENKRKNVKRRNEPKRQKGER